MGEFLWPIVSEFWRTLGEMAPYLLFGFLVAGVLASFVPPGMVEKHLGGSGLKPVFKAALFGVPLPLCSCSVIPVAASLRRHGSSRAATAAFLVSTPQTGVDSIAVTYGLLGPVLAVIRPLAALFSGVVCGLLVKWFGGRSEDPQPCADECCAPSPVRRPGFARILHHGFVALPRDLGKSLLAGLVVAGLIAAFIPPNFLADHVGSGLGSMLLMMLLGILMYVCATASVPIAAALMLKGVSPGAAMVFLVTGPATNPATMAALLKLLGRRSTALYLLSIAGTALLCGWLIDSVFGVTSEHVRQVHVHGAARQAFNSVWAVLLVAVLAQSFFRRSGKGRTGHRNCHADELGH